MYKKNNKPVLRLVPVFISFVTDDHVGAEISLVIKNNFTKYAVVPVLFVFTHHPLHFLFSQGLFILNESQITFTFCVLFLLVV